ncbi:MAG: transposase [Gammaproteobacteria bacterium]|nr:transposase [Gammaproteobacteria bacterium]
MKKKEKLTFYNYHFKHTAVSVTNYPDILSIDVAKALGIHPIMLYRWLHEMREGTLKGSDQEARSTSKLLLAEKKIKKLESELKRGREENTILKKADLLSPGKK